MRHPAGCEPQDHHAGRGAGHSKLFLRTTRGMVPTDSGLLLREKADLILETAQDIRSSIGARAQAERSHMKVGFSPGTLFTLGLEEVMGLFSRHEDWQFDLDEFSDTECESRVLDGQLDFAFTIRPDPGSALTYEPICKDNYVVVMGKEHPLAGRTGLTLDEVAKYRQVSLDDTFRMQGQLARRFREMGLLPIVRTRINHDLNVAYDLVRDNESLFVFVEGLISETVMRRTVCLPLQDPGLFWDIGIVARAETLTRYPLIQQLAADCRATACENRSTGRLGRLAGTLKRAERPRLQGSFKAKCAPTLRPVRTD